MSPANSTRDTDSYRKSYNRELREHYREQREPPRDR